MTARAPLFSPATAAILRNTDRLLRVSNRGDLTRRYAFVRSALAGLAPLDAFYIAHYKAGHVLVISYIFDGEQRLAPEVVVYGQGGVADWVRVSRQPYVYGHDQGRRIHRGIPLGDASEVTRDAVCIPLLDADGEPVGVMSAQSLTPRSYDEEYVRAMTWIGRALMQTIARDHEDVGDLDLYELYPELDSQQVTSEDDLLNRVSERLQVLNRLLHTAREHAEDVGAEAIIDAVGQAQDEADRMQTEVAELVTGYGQSAASVAVPLTSREREVADLIASEQLSNAALAARLHISEKTVKTHVGNVLKKLGITQRSEIAWSMSPTSQPRD